MVAVVKDVILLRGISVDLHQEQIEPTPVYNDNQSASISLLGWAGYMHVVHSNLLLCTQISSVCCLKHIEGSCIFSRATRLTVPSLCCV